MRKPQTTQLSDKSIADSAKAIARDPDLSVIPDNSVLAVRLGMQTPETGIILIKISNRILCSQERCLMRWKG